MKQTKIFFFGIVLLLSACSKEQVDINVGSSEPLFKVNLLRDGLEPLLIEAGKEDFYLFTNYESGATEDVLLMISEFSKLENCIADCATTFSVQINNIPKSEVESYFGSDADFSKFDFSVAPDEPGHIVLSYTQSNGIRYQTDWGPQNDESAFTIQSIEPYEKNELGLNTKLLRVAFSATFYNEVNEQFSVANGELVFAVAVP